MQNWPTKKLGELLIANDTGIWGNLIHNDEKGILILRSTNFENDGSLNFRDIAKRKIPKNKIENLQLQNGDILLEKSGGGPEQPVGRVSYFVAPDNQIYAFANFIQRLRPNQDVINSRFLFHYLFYLYKIGTTLRLQSQTTGIRNLNLNLYLKIKIPTLSLHIQHQIVEQLDAIRKAQELNDKQIALVEELLKSILHEEFLLSSNWRQKRLYEVSKAIITGGTPPTENRSFFEPEVNWATPVDFNESYPWINETERKVSDLAIQKNVAPLIPARSLMIVCIGATIGKIALSGKEMSTNQQINSVIFNESMVIPEFAYYYFIRNKNLIIRYAKITTLPILNKSLTGKIIIQLPPLGIQHQIVAKLQAVQDYKKKLLEQKQKLQELFDSCLDKTMKGELVK